MLRDDLLGFVEARGDVDMAVAVIDGRPLTTGTDPDAERLAAVPVDAATSGLLATDRGLVQVAVAPIGADGSGDRLVFGDRLDSDFALEVRQLTGFDLAILDRAGDVSVASDPDAAAAVGPTIGTADGVSREGSLAAGWMRPVGASGSVIVVTAREDEVQSLLGPLPVVLVVMLVIGALLAVLVALVVGRDLNTRLATIHRGLIDVAAGRRPEPAAVAGGPDVDRLAGALDGLVTAMDRRERILREASQTVAGWDPGEGETAVARAAVDGAVRIFEFHASTLTASGGRVLASTGDGAAGPGDRRVEAPLEMSAEDPGWLVGQAPADPAWTDADDALLGMYASLVGGGPPGRTRARGAERPTGATGTGQRPAGRVPPQRQSQPADAAHDDLAGRRRPGGPGRTNVTRVPCAPGARHPGPGPSTGADGRPAHHRVAARRRPPAAGA